MPRVVSLWMIFGIAVVAVDEASVASDFIPLGALYSNSETFLSEAHSVTSSGDMVVGTASVGTTTTAFIWHDGAGMQMLPSSSPTLLAEAVASDGGAVVGRAGTAEATLGESFIWSPPDSLQIFGGIELTPIGSMANDISTDGVVVGWCPTAARSVEAYRWTAASGFTALGVLPGGRDFSEAKGVAEDGVVVVGHADSAEGQQAFRWTEVGGMVGLGDLPGGEFGSVAWDVSGNGSVIVGTGASVDYSEEAFRWQQGLGMTGLGVLSGMPPEQRSSHALAVTADGSVVVGSSGIVQPRAFVWDDAHGIRDLRTALVNDFDLAAELAGWSLDVAFDVSADGRAIVGRGTNPEGKLEAWLVRLDQPISLPEPSAVTMLVALGAWVELSSWRCHRQASSAESQGAPPQRICRPPVAVRDSLPQVGGRC